MEKSIKYWIFISVIAACTVFLCFKQLKNSNWNRCISSDGKGYYAYLPAVFIYHDLQFQFVDQYETKYYQPENKVNFTNKYQQNNVNKYWMGTAILMSPFFITAHFCANILNLPNDGYSFVYQMMIAIAACFYLLLGLHFMRKFLMFYHSNETVIFITLFAIVFATNLFYYTVAEPSMSHVYSMFAISCFAYFTKKYFNAFNKKYFIYAALVLGLIILIRPSNAIIIFALPFLAGSLNNLKLAFKRINWIYWFFAVMAVIAIVAFQLFYYKVASGSFFIYSYGNEHFNFLSPHVMDFLFSYRRGLFVYAPILLMALLGFYPLAQKSVFQAISLSVFILLSIYFLSSWWMWYYGGGFGMRPVIDFFVFFAVLLALSINLFLQKKVLKWVGLFIIGSFIFMTQIQTYQKVNFILPWDGINKEIYWKVFLKTDQTYIGKYH